MGIFNLFKKEYGLGIDISDHSIKALSLSAQKDVAGYARIILDEGVIKDGNVSDKTELAQKLREVLDSVDPLIRGSKQGYFFWQRRKWRIVVSLPEINVFLHYWRTPQEVEVNNERAYASENAKKLIPFGEDAICWDVLSVPNGILYAAIKKDTLNDYAEVMRLAKIEHYVFDVGSLSLGRAILPQSRLEELRKNNNLPVSVMIMDIGGFTTNISLWNSRNVLCLSITIPIAGNHFTRTIKEKFNVSESEAEKMKRTIGFDYKKGDDRTIVVLQLQSDLQKILREVSNALSYYEEEYGEKVVEILLSGGSALVPQIDFYIATNLDRDVRIIDPLFQLNSYNEAMRKRESAVLFPNVIGLALRGVSEKQKGINLSSSLEKPDNSFPPVSKSTKILLFVSVLVFLTSLLGWVVWKYIFIPQRIPIVPVPQPDATTSMEISSSITVSQKENPMNGTSTDSLSTDEALSSTTENGILNMDVSSNGGGRLIVTDTPTGWLNVRENPVVDSPQISRVYPGQSFVFFEKAGEWYKIDLGTGKLGFVSAQYVKIAF